LENEFFPLGTALLGMTANWLGFRVFYDLGAVSLRLSGKAKTVKTPLQQLAFLVPKSVHGTVPVQAGLACRHHTRISTERKQRAKWEKQSGRKTHQYGAKLTVCDTKL
jgi:hypothetical protein